MWLGLIQDDISTLDNFWEWWTRVDKSPPPTPERLNMQNRAINAHQIQLEFE